MIEVGTRIIIEGIPYKIESCNKGKSGKYVLVIDIDRTCGNEIRDSINLLLDELLDIESKKIISKKVIEWFINEKLKAGISIGSIARLKTEPEMAERQIRTLLRNGESIESIVETLAFWITNKWWSANVLASFISSFATKKVYRNPNNTFYSKESEIPLYYKIKEKMIALRQSNVEKIHIESEEETDGRIIVE